MKLLHTTAVTLLLLAAPLSARAGDEVLAPGNPPLTRALADRKVAFWESVFGLRPDDRQRAELRQLQAGEWGRRDADWKGRWVRFLDDWQASASGANADRFRTGAGRAALDSLAQTDADTTGTWFLARSVATAGPAAGRPGSPEAVALEVLRRRQAEHDQMMRMMAGAQREHHETMMLIIRNIGPTGRYEYNPATGRYDRYVPYP